MIRLQERRIERNKRFFKNESVSVVRKREPFRGPLRPRPVTKAFSRRANHQFTLVVLILRSVLDLQPRFLGVISSYCFIYDFFYYYIIFIYLIFLLYLLLILILFYDFFLMFYVYLLSFYFVYYIHLLF